MTDQNQINLSGVVKLVKSVLISFLVIEFIFMIILGNYFYFAGYYPVYWIAMLEGFFTTVSSITNSGFDITGASLIPFQNDYFVQTLLMFLMFFGAMGFPVILDIQKYFNCKKTKQRFKFSIYTKLTMITTIILWIVGIIGFYIFEYNHFLADKGLIEGFFYATFNSLSTRNAGFATFDMNAFSTATLTMFCGLMFIGSSPNSSGGGIRTTTFALMVLAILSFARGKQYVNIYGREIETQTVYKSFMIYIVATLIVCLSTLGLGLLLMVTLKKQNAPYLFIGFIMATFLDMPNVLPIAIVGIALAAINFMYNKKIDDTAAKAVVYDGGEEDGI